MILISKLLQALVQLKSFILFWLGQSLSQIGTNLTFFALGIWTFEQNQSVTQLSIMFFLTTLPGVLITPFVGPIIDYWNRRWIIIFSDIAAAIVSLILGISAFRGQLSMNVIYMTMILVSLVGSFQLNSKGAVMSLLVPKQFLGRANGLIKFSEAMAQILCPFLASVLIVKIKLQGIFFIDFLSFFFAIITLLMIHIPNPPKTHLKLTPSNIINNISYGWQYILSRFSLLIILIYIAIFHYFTPFTNVLLYPLILSFSSAYYYAEIMSLAGLAVFLGSLLVSIWGGGKKKIKTMLMGFLGSGIGLIIMGIKASIPVISIGVFVFFFCLPIILTTYQAMIQAKVPSEIQGRVFAAFGTLTGLCWAFGNLSAGFLAEAIFEPLLKVDGLLSNNIGQIVGVGNGRGIGVLIILEGLLMLIIIFFFQQTLLVKKMIVKFKGIG